MSKSIYIAGGSSECREVAEYVRRLTEAGFTITYDWANELIAQGLEPGKTAEGSGLTVESQRVIASMELTAVRIAHIFWYMVPKLKSEGSAVELGAALTYNSYTVVSGPYERNLFAQLCDFKFSDHEEAFQFITNPDYIPSQKIGV